jgi:hypothetical protein
MIGRYFCVTALSMIATTALMAQVTSVTPVPAPTIVPIVDQQTNLTSGAATVPLVQKTVTLSQGQMLRVLGRLEFTGDVGETPGTGSNTAYVDAWLECFDPNGNPVRIGEQDIGQNFLGPTTPAGPSARLRGVDSEPSQFAMIGEATS